MRPAATPQRRSRVVVVAVALRPCEKKMLADARKVIRTYTPDRPTINPTTPTRAAPAQTPRAPPRDLGNWISVLMTNRGQSTPRHKFTSRTPLSWRRQDPLVSYTIDTEDSTLPPRYTSSSTQRAATYNKIDCGCTATPCSKAPSRAG